MSTPYDELAKQFAEKAKAEAVDNNIELELLFREIRTSILIEKIPKALLDFSTDIGIDPQKISRATQIVVDMIATQELAATDLPGPFDAYVGKSVREFLVNLIAKKFNALISGGSTA